MKKFFRILAYRLRTPPPEHWRKQLAKLLWLLLFPLALLLKEWASASSSIVENTYSKGAYPIISQGISFFFGWIPFSAAEMILYSGILAILVYIIYQIVLLIIKRERILRTFKVLIHLAMIVSIGYFVFIAVWGLNYYRQPLAVTMGYKVAPRSVADLKKLCTQLAAKANELRPGLMEDIKGSVKLLEGKSELLKKVPSAYVELSSQFPLFKAKYGPPKPVLLSRYMSYMDTQGIYIPFTVEPNVNADIPDAVMASTACHEVAHQYGFAREDEANYIGYLACMASGDSEMMYSGVLMALTISMNALGSYDSDAYWEIEDTYCDGLKQDLDVQYEYWKQFDGPVAEASSDMNNAYLKSNKQADGVNSYGRMVDLLLAQMLANEQN